MNKKSHKFYIKTFGCAQNEADSQRIRAMQIMEGGSEVGSWKEADKIIINSCVVRQSAENRVYGLINEVNKYKDRSQREIKVILTGCLAGLRPERQIKGVDRIVKISDFGFDINPLRETSKAALVPISSGCNNFCSYCIVPYCRGREVSRKMKIILNEIDGIIGDGFEEVVLIGQNVNSYGADFGGKKVTALGKRRIKSMFPDLLEEAAKKKLKKISFVSSNPWDFSDELIETIARHSNIDRLLHLPLQSGDDEILKKMNRGYSASQYIDLVRRIRSKVDGVKFSTDIIIGFPGEDSRAFDNTVRVCKEVGFEIAYLNKYSPRKGTLAAKLYGDDIPMDEKKRRWQVLNKLINKA